MAKICYTTSCYTVQHPHLVAAGRHCPSFPQHTCCQLVITVPYLSRGSPSSWRQFVLLFTQPHSSDPVTRLLPNPAWLTTRLLLNLVAEPCLPACLPDYPPVAEPCCRHLPA